MNRFEQEYIKIINEWNSNLLLEANLKSLILNIQQRLIGNKSYNDLNDNEKRDLQEDINATLSYIERKVNEITDNKQYQSWIYNVLKNKEVNYNDLNPLKSLILDFERLSKRPDIKPNQKNIQNYSSLKNLQQFIDQFKEEHNLSEGIYSNLKKIYQNEEFTVYFINKNQYNECNKLFGGIKYFNTGWCIAKNSDYFNIYIHDNKDKFNGYFVFIKDNKPYALLHYGSGQFKDTSDQILETNNPNILDCLYNINDNLNDYQEGDLKYYKFLKENPNASKEDWIAYQIGGKYDPKTKIIDCNGNYIQFKDEWLNDEGTFDFNFINVTNDWSNMFFMCTNLTKLPDNFAIPNNVKRCDFMFSNCTNLTKLPDNFTIPNSIIRCDGMFFRCKNLTKLPDNFTIPNNVENCRWMFFNCENLKELPDKFNIPKHSDYRHIFINSGLEDKYNIDDLLK